MKKINKYVFAIIAFALAFVVDARIAKATNTYINNNGIEMTEEEYSTLQNLGFTKDEIKNMSIEIFEENKDLHASLISQTKKYYKIVVPTYGTQYVVEVTPEEYYNHSDEPMRGYVSTYWLDMTSSISANGSLYRYKNTVIWSNIPSVKSYDVIGIGFNGNVHINSNSTFYYTYTNSNGASSTSYSYFSRLVTSTGETHTFKLPSNFVGLGATMYFDVAKDSGAGTITSLSMCGDYAHATQTVTGAQAASHGIDLSGISFDGSVINYFNAIPCANTNISVNW